MLATNFIIDSLCQCDGTQSLRTGTLSSCYCWFTRCPAWPAWKVHLTLAPSWQWESRAEKFARLRTHFYRSLAFRGPLIFQLSCILYILFQFNVLLCLNVVYNKLNLRIQVSEFECVYVVYSVVIIMFRQILWNFQNMHPLFIVLKFRSTSTKIYHFLCTLLFNYLKILCV